MTGDRVGSPVETTIRTTEVDLNSIRTPKAMTLRIAPLSAYSTPWRPDLRMSGATSDGGMRHARQHRPQIMNTATLGREHCGFHSLCHGGLFSRLLLQQRHCAFDELNWKTPRIPQNEHLIAGVRFSNLFCQSRSGLNQAGPQ
jgi:hypothetical protein